MPGPAPKHPSQRRRRNTAQGLTRLPAEGRDGRAPKWPLAASPDPVTARAERALWRSLWSTPQAVAWERSGWTRVVARYTRLLTGIEAADGAAAALLAEVRQLEDRLGLTPLAMQRLRWEVVEAPPAESGDSAPVTQLDEYRRLLA